MEGCKTGRLRVRLEGMVAGTSGGAPSNVSQLWRMDDFRKLLVGQAVSGLGDWMATVALMTVALEITGSSTAVGGVLVLRLAPAVVAGPVAGRISRRWDRRGTMLAMDAARIAIVAVLPLVRELWWVYLWAFMLEVAGLVFLPARDASIPDLVEEDDLPLANGLVLGSSYGTIPLGAGAFAAIHALTGSATIAFWIDAATFAVSFWMIRGISLQPSPAPEGAGPVGPGADDDVSFRRALRIPLVRSVGPIAFVVSVGLGALFSVGIIFVREVLGATDVEFAVLVALFGVGAGLGLAALHLLGVEPTMPAIRSMVVGQGVVVAGMSLSPTIGLAFVGAVLFGAATASTLATAMSLLQSRLPSVERTLAFTAFHVLIRAGIGAAAIGAGVAADLVDDVELPLVGSVAPARSILVSCGLLVVATGTAGWRLGTDVDLAAE
jgi:MFS family permease